MTDDSLLREVVAFWREAGHERWYTPDADFDAAVRDRFFALWREAAAGQFTSWEHSDEGALALVIVLDQFPRNMFRGDAKAFSSDALAREVANRALQRGVDRRMEPPLLQFLYLPFMHSEHLPDQIRCVELFRAGDNAENLGYAEIHADIIRRFGRFPHRNRILRRITTPEEQAFLDAGGFSG
ncbi:DUF924 family protein [Bradyrhizobium sp.]|uniref:DUF924 family protein n=1 Tax=Bradyrhizobium sp. TaxID=376 RepID=UPI002620B4E6|nr:DUF924 family protein [Bradyrhizobium sp.]